jgi:hypothetical protein
LEAGMFVVGEAKGKVLNGKLALPREFHLRKRKLNGKWKDSCTLYLSDNDKSLNYAAGKNNDYFTVNIDSDDNISLSEEFENNVVIIRGCISTVELEFVREKGGFLHVSG